MTFSKPAKLKKCRVCRVEFRPLKPLQFACSLACAQTWAGHQRLKAERREDKARLLEMQPTGWFRAKAKTAMHAFVRYRDEGKSCISCDTLLVKLGRVGGDYDAGHVRSVQKAKHLEFDPRNVHGQCKHCNDWLGGNLEGCLIGLKKRFGAEFVRELLDDNEPRHLKIHDFQQIEAHYKALLKELKEQRKREAA